MRITIGTPSHNRRPFTELFIRYVFKNTENEFDLVVSDDSTDGSYEWMKEKYGDSITIVRPDKPYSGASAARNAYIRQFKTEIGICIDNDCIVPKGWDVPLVEAVSSHPEYSMALSATEDMYFFPQLDYLRKVCDKFKSVYSFDAIKSAEDLERVLCNTYPDGLNRFYENHKFAMNGVTPWHFSNTWVSYAVRTAHMRKVGGYDELYKMAGFEDLDLARRFGLIGLTSVVIPQSYVHHFCGTTRGTSAGAQVQESKNKEWFYSKMGPNYDPCEGWLDDPHR